MSDKLPEVDTSGFEQHIAAHHAALRGRMAGYALRLQLEISRRVRAEIDEQGSSIGERSSSARIGSRSGALADALMPGGRGNHTERVINDDGLAITTGIDADLIPYAAIHEYGGTIEPRSAGALTIPVSAEAVKALADADGDIRSLDLVVVRTVSGQAALARKRGETLDIMFLLVRSVTIPARPFWNPGVEEWTRSDLPRFTDSFTSDLIDLWNAT